MTEHATHGPSTRHYLMVFAGLAALTAATVLISYSGLDETKRTIIAFTIAAIKTAMVASIFMHLRYESKIILIFAVAPVLLAIVFILAISPDIGVVR